MQRRVERTLRNVGTTGPRNRKRILESDGECGLRRLIDSGKWKVGNYKRKRAEGPMDKSVGL